MPNISKCQVKCMEAILSGALRREKLAETAFQKLENEMEHVNQLVCDLTRKNFFSSQFFFFCQFSIISVSTRTKCIRYLFCKNLSKNSHMQRENLC